MKGYQFEDTQGTFHLKKAENISYLYFPIAGEAGLKSSFTPNLGGDAKIDQNTFLLEPVSAENLVNNRNSRNCYARNNCRRFHITDDFSETAETSGAM